ncbi:unnamed protein product, partial [Laminaria digitata]
MEEEEKKDEVEEGAISTGNAHGVSGVLSGSTGSGHGDGAAVSSGCADANANADPIAVANTDPTADPTADADPDNGVGISSEDSSRAVVPPSLEKGRADEDEDDSGDDGGHPSFDSPADEKNNASAAAAAAAGDGDGEGEGGQKESSRRRAP